MTRRRTTRDEFTVQGNYGYGHGYEDVSTEDTRAEARQRLKEYRKNERGIPFRIVKRRVRIEPANV
jgi:uncharacterized protein YjlB